MAFALDWNRLLSDRRAPLPSDTAPAAARRNRFEQDYDRVIFSAPFRRLAGKTQVHPFAAIDHVHNRLTHTLEVASVGRSLAYTVGRDLVARGEMPADRTPEDLACIVQSACLAHDIGNPPFGHAGEYAIRAWADKNLPDLFPDAAGPLRDVVEDWIRFEGNAQGFRLVARPDNRDQDYFHLTYATLGAMIKYPWTSADPRAAARGKHNAFSSERALFDDVVGTLGLRRPDGEAARHPLSFLSEAADDICYRIADFEDAVEMGILPEAEVRDIFTRIIGTALPADRPLSALRARAIGRLIQAAVDTFAADSDAILAGRRTDDLKSGFPAAIRAEMATIKTRYESIFSHRTKVAVELGAPATLGRILDVYARAVRELATKRSYKELGFVHQRCLTLAWNEAYVRAHETEDISWWLGRVMDHVSGMTDAHATQVSREIAGS